MRQVSIGSFLHSLARGKLAIRDRSHGLLRYASVIFSVAVAALLRLPLHSLLGNKVAFITLFPAIVYSAWVAGFGGGLFATALCTLAAAWFIIPPARSLIVSDASDQFSLLIFALVGATISILGHAQHRAQQHAEASARRAAKSARSAKKSEAVLQESETRKAAILEAALDCIITIDDQGQVIEWNSAAEQTFGYPRSVALGQTLVELIIPPSLRLSHRNGMAHFFATGEGPVLGKRIEVPALNAEGREFPVELTIAAIRLGERTIFTAYLRDLTERERSAALQRTFLRDVLFSVTEGHLRLCHLPAELPTMLTACGEPITISRTGGLAELRRAADLAAVTHGFAAERCYDLVTATSEAAMNAAVHGNGGLSRVCSNGDTIQIWIEDQGTGINVAKLPQATLEKGYSSAGTLGHGMKMMLSTADRVWLLTGSTGTTVVLEQDRLAPISVFPSNDAQV